MLGRLVARQSVPLEAYATLTHIGSVGRQPTGHTHVQWRQYQEDIRKDEVVVPETKGHSRTDIGKLTATRVKMNKLKSCSCCASTGLVCYAQVAILTTPLRLEATAVVCRERAGYLADLLEPGVVHGQPAEGVGNA
jgi:hypothetical protein